MRRWLPIALFLVVGCASKHLRKEQAEWRTAFGARNPPGTMVVGDSLFYDRTELTNLSWLEYQYWIEKTLGASSPEYRATMPDTSAWYRITPPDSLKALHYLRHPAYWDYPVVGISIDQARAYSAWRSDRVMELYLFGAGIIRWDEAQTPENHFTIARFYATDSLRPYHHLPYPSYDLPTSRQWRQALHMADSLSGPALKRCRLRKSPFSAKDRAFCEALFREGSPVVNSREESVGRPNDPIAESQCFRCNDNMIWHIRGNVSELCRDSSVSLGGSWLDPLDSILLDQPFPSHAPNAATGFRNVCRWRKWNGTRQ